MSLKHIHGSRIAALYIPFTVQFGYDFKVGSAFDSLKEAF
jgi:hypothetical protein